MQTRNPRKDTDLFHPGKIHQHVDITVIQRSHGLRNGIEKYYLNLKLRIVGDYLRIFGIESLAFPPSSRKQ